MMDIIEKPIICQHNFIVPNKQNNNNTPIIITTNYNNTASAWSPVTTTVYAWLHTNNQYQVYSPPIDFVSPCGVVSIDLLLIVKYWNRRIFWDHRFVEEHLFWINSLD